MADDELLREDETQLRLLEWRKTSGQGEHLAAQVLDAEGYKDIDPSHPLGGPDDGHDGRCTKDGEPWTWAAYFPRGQKKLSEIKSKLADDIAAARKHEPKGVAFVTNQEVRLADRAALRALGGDDLEIDVFHNERVATILDRPRMAPVRQEYLRIGAGRPPVRVRAEVLGAARTFVDGGKPMLEWFVERYEKKVREESDKGWARVRAEEAAKARAIAEKAQQEALEARRNRPKSLHDLGLEPMSSTRFDYQSIMPKYEFPHLDNSSYIRKLLGKQYGASEPPPPSEPLTDEQINEKVANYRAQLEARWDSCQDYVAATVWPGLKFRIHNAEGFLTHARVVLTFHGARGLRHKDIEDFVWQKVQNPSWKQPVDPARPWAQVMEVGPLIPRSGSENPVTWDHDENGDLVVRIALAQLPPREDWPSDDDDVVLVLRDKNLDAVKVSYTVTAQEHHDRIDGEPIIVPVEEIDILDSVQAGIDAAKLAD